MHTALTILAALVILIIPAAAPPPASGAGELTTSLVIPLDGQVFTSAGEPVSLAGSMEIVTHLRTEFPCDPGFVQIRPDGVSGIGLATGSTYLVVGMAATNLPCTSPDPAPLFPQFSIFHTSNPNPHNRPNPFAHITFRVQLDFDAAGNLVGADVAVQ